MIKYENLFYLDRDNDNFDIDSISLSFYRDNSQLSNSIKQFGIFRPILVRKTGKAWQVISGKGRLACAKEKKVPAMEILCNDFEAFVLYIYDNLDSGFNDVEISKIILRLHRDFKFSLREISNSYAHLLGLTTGIKVLKNYLEIIKLPEYILEYLAQGKININSALILLDFDEKDQNSLVKLNEKMEFNYNKQKEVFSLLWELTRANSTSIERFLERAEFKKILNQEKPALFADTFRKSLKQLKNPVLHKTESDFNKIIKEQKLNYPVIIKHSPNFEQEEISINFRFKNTANFQKAMQNLQNLYDNGSISRLLDIEKLK